MTPEQKGETRFCVFRSPEWGIRALVKIIQTYERKYSLDTVRGIINRWAPPVENDTGSYISQVAKALDVEPDEPLNIFKARTMLVLCKAIIRHENGVQPYDDATIRAGIALAGVKAPKPKPLLASKRLRGGAMVGGATTRMSRCACREPRRNRLSVPILITGLVSRAEGAHRKSGSLPARHRALLDR